MCSPLSRGREQYTVFSCLFMVSTCSTLCAISILFGKIGQWEQPLLCALRDGFTPLAFATFLPKLFGALVSIPL